MGQEVRLRGSDIHPPWGIWRGGKPKHSSLLTATFKPVLLKLEFPYQSLGAAFKMWIVIEKVVG